MAGQVCRREGRGKLGFSELCGSRACKTVDKKSGRLEERRKPAATEGFQLEIETSCSISIWTRGWRTGCTSACSHPPDYLKKPKPTKTRLVTTRVWNNTRCTCWKVSKWSVINPLWGAVMGSREFYQRTFWKLGCEGEHICRTEFARLVKLRVK